MSWSCDLETRCDESYSKNTFQKYSPFQFNSFIYILISKFGRLKMIKIIFFSIQIWHVFNYLINSNVKNSNIQNQFSEGGLEIRKVFVIKYVCLHSSVMVSALFNLLRKPIIIVVLLMLSALVVVKQLCVKCQCECVH